VVKEVAAQYLAPLIKSRVDTVILGCTHYPLLKPVIREVLGDSVVLIDSAKQVAVEVKKILASEGQLSKAKRGRQSFYVSDNPEWFSGLAARFLGTSIKNAKKANSDV
jgi:glutamate racemase